MFLETHADLPHDNIGWLCRADLLMLAQPRDSWITRWGEETGEKRRWGEEEMGRGGDGERPRWGRRRGDGEERETRRGGLMG